MKNIEEAKKYLNKIIYLVDTEKTKPTKLYIGGVNLFYNQVEYEVVGFAFYEDNKCTKFWGDVELKRIKDKFEKNYNWSVYTFSKDLAIQYLIHQKRTEEEKRKDEDIEEAEELLKKHKVNYEIFN